ncbi:unnamed protein product, partial [marine sediment metagenome]
MDFSDASINLNEFLKNNPDLTSGLSSFLVEAVSSGYRVLNADEISKSSDSEQSNYLDFSILPEESQRLFLQKMADSGMVVTNSWLDMMDDSMIPTYIDHRLRKNGVIKFEDIWDRANNRQRMYYFKKAASNSRIVPESIISQSDSRMVKFYLDVISKNKKILPDFLFDKFSDKNKRDYMNNLGKSGIMDINSISEKQVSELGDDDAKKMIDPLVKRASKFPFLLSNKVFDGLSDNVKNYYIGRIFQIYNAKEEAISDALTKHQLKWGQEYGFL